MPTYEYHCDSCDRNFDVVQSFHDEPLDACPTCGSPVRKVFGSVGIVFKGSGFYKTDSRKKTTAKAGEAGSGSDGAPAKDARSDGAGTGSGEGPAPAPAKVEPGPAPAPAAPSGNGSSSGAKESAKT